MKKTMGGLGKGLDTIFAENYDETNENVNININDIEPNRDQPRKDFDPESLSELADSIAQHGVLQPILVRPIFAGGYQLVAGERRWRAAKMAGLTEIPAIIKDMDDREFMEISLIENLQREDLTPVEEARGFNTLMENYGLTQEDVSKSVGKSRSAIANTMRLLKLPEEVLEMIENGLLSAGHGRTLLALEDQSKVVAIADRVIEEQMSVRELERLVKRENEGPKEVKHRKQNHYYEEVRLAMGEYLGRKVRVSGTKKKGVLTIEFYGEEDLAELVKQLEKRNNQ